ncbi:MAG: adenosylcobinamide-GDP ribazoletransferase [Leptospiraceae bacterium]|nr:adenosylcobinamide-GDP ribazoletransferase [Leptospiraceae bacterium]MCZ8346045.1 adenosylcobinamide-GDP ribazoletransferase [Leptospiraceae bacterium]PJE00995.1 MAG: adenosylcobinamide-GDP ribazoletransferase [Leptospira sp.]
MDQEQESQLPYSNYLGNEYGRFAQCLMFLTRLPKLPHHYHPLLLSTCHHYFPLVGLVIGVILSLIYYYSFSFLGNWLAVWFVLGFSILLTGAFHEDGFADTCDGLGGGWTLERKLEIMKDSRLGTYGTLGLIFLIGFKYLILSSYDKEFGWKAILIGSILSRTIIVPLSFTLKYMGQTGIDKPMPSQVTKWKALTTVCIGWVLVSFVLGREPFLWFTLIAIFILLLFLSHFFLKSQIKGYTGDTLGAVNQVMEVLVYFSFFLYTYAQSSGYL